MRWLIVNDKTPSHGTLRSVAKFAWLPVAVEDWKVWLEFYVITEKFFQPSSGAVGWWTPIKTSFYYSYD